MNKDLLEPLYVPDSVLDKWQRLIDALANLMKVPAALIMKIDYPYLEALILSKNENNPIPPGYKEKIFGTYCEITIKNKEMHEVNNAFRDPIHKNKPGLEENSLISYLGFPLEWPTGEMFGTICVADQEERYFSNEERDLMKELKISVDAHLELIYKNKLLKRAHQRIREQRDNLKLLTSTVRHDIANNLTYINGFLDLKRMRNELPEDYIQKLLPYIKSSINSIENIKKLENLFTKEKRFKKVHPRTILEDLDTNLSYPIEIHGNCIVHADEFLELAFKELIRNAFKHTDTSKVDIYLSEDNDGTRIKVQDYGRGLSQDVVKSHFKNKNVQRELKGLTIIEKIMDRYGGDLLYTKNEKGSVFELVWYKSDEKFLGNNKE